MLAVCCRAGHVWTICACATHLQRMTSLKLDASLTPIIPAMLSHSAEFSLCLYGKVS